MSKLENRNANIFKFNTLTTEQLPNQTIGSVLMLASNTGAVNCLLPVANILAQKKVPVYFQTQGIATEILEKKCPGLPAIKAPLTPDWLLESGQPLTSFEIDTIKKIRQTNSRVRIGLIEDFPGCLSEFLDQIVDSNIYPRLITTPTRLQSLKYRQRYPNLSDISIIPIGQPGFDTLLANDLPQQGEQSKKKLGISDDTYVITYFGTKTSDHSPLNTNTEEFTDLNSITLRELLRSMLDLATDHQNKQFCMINRPHPGERPDLWQHPFFEHITQLPNLQIINHTKTDWEKLQLATQTIYAASNVSAMIMSTLGEEIALACTTIKDPNKTVPVPLYILPADLTKYANTAHFSDGLRIADIGAVACNIGYSELQLDLEKCLFDNRFTSQIRRNQAEILSKEYRFGRSATNRVYLILKAVEEGFI